MENTETNTNLKWKQMDDIYLSLIYSINSRFSIKLNTKVDESYNIRPTFRYRKRFKLINELITGVLRFLTTDSCVIYLLSGYHVTMQLY